MQAENRKIQILGESLKHKPLKPYKNEICLELLLAHVELALDHWPHVTYQMLELESKPNYFLHLH